MFFIGVSKYIITKYLKHRYKKDYGIDGIDGEEYLNKIIPLPFNIPLPQKEAVETLIRERSGSDQLGPGLLDIIRIASKHKPRKAIRLLNVHSVLNLIIDGESEDSDVVGINHHMIWEALDLYDEWRDNIKFFIKIENVRILSFFEELLKKDSNPNAILKREAKGNNEYYSIINKTIENDSFLMDLIKTGDYFKQIITNDEKGKKIRSKLRNYDVYMQRGQGSLEKQKEEAVQILSKNYINELKIYDFIIESDDLGKAVDWEKELGEKKKIIVEKAPKEKGYFEYDDYMEDRLSPVAQTYIYILPSISKMEPLRLEKIGKHMKVLREYTEDIIAISKNRNGDGTTSESMKEIENQVVGIVYEVFSTEDLMVLLLEKFGL